MYRPRYPHKFKTRRELLWYVRGLKDSKVSFQENIKADEERYLSALDHMEFDKEGNVIQQASVQPSFQHKPKKK